MPTLSRTLWTDDEIAEFVQREYPMFYPVFAAITVPVMKVDLFRYMVIYEYGGVYADMDTECLVPVQNWLSISGALTRAQFFHQGKLYSGREFLTQSGRTELVPIRCVIAVESDTSLRGLRNYTSIQARSNQLCQWTFGCAAGHPLLQEVVTAVVRKIRSTTILEFAFESVMEVTGPGIFTDSVRNYLYQSVGLTESDYDNVLGNVLSPRIFGDVLLLPQVSFREPDNSHPEWRDSVLVWHHFAGTWKV